MNTDKSSFEEYYKGIKKVYCPYFKDNIYFTGDGFDHIRFKKKHAVRPFKDMRMRIDLLPTVLKIIGASHTLQNRSLRRRFEYRYVNSRKESALTDVTYYEFVAIMDERRVRVVVKQIENFEKIFLSVIPVFNQKMPPSE